MFLHRQEYTLRSKEDETTKETSVWHRGMDDHAARRRAAVCLAKNAASRIERIHGIHVAQNGKAWSHNIGGKTASDEKQGLTRTRAKMVESNLGSLHGGNI